MRLYHFFIDKYAKTICQVKCIALFIALITIYMVLTTTFISNKIAFACALFIGGWFIWTFTEYILHRFWMHGRGKAGSYHNYHHTHPTEIKVTATERTLMIIVVIVIATIALFVSSYILLFDGFIFGFAAYSCMHWVLHQSWSRKLFPRLHRFHIYHHCKYSDSCFSNCKLVGPDIQDYSTRGSQAFKSHNFVLLRTGAH